MRNFKQSEFFRVSPKNLEFLKRKYPVYVFKSHSEDKKTESKKLESYKINISYSIESGFINAEFVSEVLLTKEKSDWIYKDKDEELTTLGGLGLVNLWDYLEGP